MKNINIEGFYLNLSPYSSQDKIEKMTHILPKGLQDIPFANVWYWQGKRLKLFRRKIPPPFSA